MKQNFANIPVGVMDTDSDLTRVSPKNFIASLNMRQNPGEGARRNLKGNEIVPYTQPVGINETIGHVEDKYKATGIEFVKNNAGDDQIRRYWQLEDRYELLLEMDMDLNNHISEAGVIDGRHLFWTDFNGSTGNEPRYIDMDYISLYNKKLCYELYWDSQSFDAAEEYTIEIVGIDGTPVLPEEVFFTAAGGDPDGDAQDLADALSGYDVTVDFCGNKIIICAATEEQRIIIAGQGIHFSPTNHYPETVLDEYISLIRMMPKQPPVPRFTNDVDIKENKVFGFVFQFRYRYIYWNSSKSKWSPISYVPTNFISDSLAPTHEIENSELYNKIVIGFDDDLLGSQDWKAFIRKVEVAVRYEQSGPWKSVDVFDVADLGVQIHEVEFLNDGTYPEVSSDEVGPVDVQALGNYDFVPRYSRTLEIVQDQVGKHLLLLGGNIEQYDQIDCVAATVEAVYDSPQDSAPTSPDDQTSLRKRFKAGGVYDTFVIYEDDFGRQWPAKKLGRFNCINPSTGDWEPGRVYPMITIDHQPPIEATRFRIGFSVNQNQGEYVSLPSFKVTYWTKDPHPTGGEGTFTSTTYGAGDADYVAFEFYVRDLDVETQTNFIFRDDNNNLLVQGGDRLHVVIDGDASAFTDEDYLIEGYNLTYPSGTATDDLYSVFIKFTSGMPNYTLTNFPDDHHNIELYRPFKGDSNIVYEVGPAYDIVDAGLSTRNHGDPIEITDLGDTYTYSYITKNYLSGATPDANIAFIERPSLYAFKKEVGSDFGRPNVEDADFSEVDSYDQIRLSDFFVPSSGINGFHSFRGTNYIRTRRDYGSLQSLQFVNGVLLAIGQFASQPIYVGKDRLMTLDGQTVGRSASVLNIGPELSTMRGTHSPASIVNNGRYVYGFDEYRGVPWRYSVGGGQDDINLGVVQEFRLLGKEVFDNGYKCLGGYQEEFDMYFLTCGRLRTVAYCEREENRGWHGDYSFVPEFYGSIGLNFYTFKSGNAWLHESDESDYCNFYGLDYNWYTVVVVNPEPQMVKLFWNLRHQGTKIWCPFINIPPGIAPEGMETRILASKFVKKEGQYRVDIPRDATDPAFDNIPSPATRYITSLLQGRRMRGEVMTVWLRGDDPQVEGYIKRLDTEWTPSMETK